jgi:hypothetical protein
LDYPQLHSFLFIGTIAQEEEWHMEDVCWLSRPQRSDH